MTEEEISKKVAAFLGTDAPVITEESVEEIVQSPQPTDLYQERARAMRESTPRKGRGSSPHLMIDLADLLDGGIQDQYKKTLDDSELLRAEGDTKRAQLLEQQYMNEWFYPTVDALVRLDSMEELLSNQEALETLDALVIVPGGGRADGYTAMFVSSLYDPLGDGVQRTDAFVRDQLRRLNRLCDENQIKAAGALARNLQSQIDAGEHQATNDDYEFIQKISLRA